jgi:peptidyl-prolyl cis-trans isomerase SurA
MTINSMRRAGSRQAPAARCIIAAMIRFVLAILLILGAPAFALAQEVRIAAVVNDDIISVNDLVARVRLVMGASNIEDTPENRRRLGRQILRGLIDEKLQLQEAKRLGIKAPDSEVEDGLARLEAQNKMPKGGLDQFIKARGLDRRSLVEQVTASISWGKVVRQSLSQLAAVSDEEVDAALARMHESAGEPKSRVAEIFLAIDNPQQEEEVHRFADRLHEQLASGSNFAQLAQQFSQSATAAVGGDIGWVTPSQLNSELAAVVERLKPREISDPIRAAGGYYLVAIIDKEVAGGGVDAERVSLTQIMFPLAAGAPEADRQRVTGAANAVSKQAKSCGELLQIGRQQAPQTSGDLGWVKLADLPADLRPTVHALKVAEASPPVPLRGGIGVLMVCDREAAPNALPGRDQVADSLTMAKYETLAQRYLRDLRRQAFIDIRI